MTKWSLHMLAGVLLMSSAAQAQFGTVTLRMNEVPTQPVDGLTVSGITFHFTFGGAASTDATINAANGGNLAFVQDPALEGNSLGTLQIDFATPVVDMVFGLARSSVVAMPAGVTVQLFGAALNPLGTFSMPVAPITTFAEGQFHSSVPQPISRAILTFPDAATVTRFALDNLTVSFVPTTVVGTGVLFTSYAANLNVLDTVFNLTNAGTNNTNLCANIYAFSPDEQMVSCCTCNVTPNALVSLSARNDLISNTLTPAVPTALVVKVLANAGGTCNAATPTASNIALGLKGWNTEVHLAPIQVADAAIRTTLTENAIRPVLLSAGELAHLTSLCGFIQSNGSGFGICRSCRLGGQGSVRQ